MPVGRALGSITVLTCCSLHLPLDTMSALGSTRAARQISTNAFEPKCVNGLETFHILLWLEVAVVSVGVRT